ncbi:MAG: MoaD/ThiS family protein [Candidatus Caccosoma sp.]|nr:MoaD/ThiS family protein [Candidatus Caccosoma sp.]
MNSKKILSMLLLSLGAFTMVLSGCKNNDNSKSDNPTSEKPSETTSEKPSSDTSSETTSSEATSSETTSSSEINVPEAKTWEVAFNVDVPKEQLTVWTDFAIDKSIAEELGSATNKVNMTGKDQTGRTLPLDTEQGMYYFAVDADGYLVYATYGLNAGFGSPSDGYYHNLDSADPYNMPFWALHDDFETWGTWYNEGKKEVELNGKKYHTFNLFNFIIPEGGFVIKGELKEQSLRELFKELVGQSPLNETGYGCAGAFDAQYNQQWGGKTVAPKELDKYYFYINDDHELALRERTADELKDAGGEQIKETPAHGELTKEDEVEKFVTIADVLALQEGKEVKDAKGVIIYVNDTVAYVQDENGNTVRVAADALKDAVVGDTVAFSGTLTTVKGQPQVNATAVRTIKGYGEVKAIAAKTVTADNVADFVGLKNNLKKVKIVGATVKDANTVELNGQTFTVDATLNAKDMVDFTGYYTVVDGKNEIHTVADVAIYAKITVNTGDVDEVKTGPKGAILEFSPAKADDAYTFVKWEVKNADGEWEEFSTERDLKVTIGDVDASYRAVFEFAPWSHLPKYYVESGTANVQSTSEDSTFTVWTEESGFHIHPTVGTGWNGQPATTWLNEEGTIKGGWRTIVAVDADGKVCYAVWCPQNGFGGPSGTGYYANASYYVTFNEETKKYETNNPAFKLLPEYGPWNKENLEPSTKFEIVVPKGGFVVTTYNDDAYAGQSAIANLVSKGEFAVLNDDNGSTFNKRNPSYDDVRLYYDKTNNTVKAFKSSLTEGEKVIEVAASSLYTAGNLVLDPTDLTPTDPDKGKNISTLDWRWRFVVIADKDGKIAYGNVNFANGWLYGGNASPDSKLYFADPSYLTEDAWKTNPAFKLANPGDASQYQIVVPEGGVGIVTGGEEAGKLISLLTNGRVTVAGDSTQSVVNSADLLGEGVRLSYKNGLVIFKAGENPVVSGPRVMVGAEKVEVASNGYTIAVDKDGQVVYASYGLTGGFGSPSDGFYHDGTWVKGANQTWGPFKVDKDWKPWSTDDQESFKKFEVIIPEGGMLISDTVEKTAAFIKELTGLDVANFGNNLLFESEVKTGALNDMQVKYENGELIVKKLTRTETKVESFEASVMTGTDEININKGGYTIALNSKGRIIYASFKTGDGFGGPADGFYHDGTYKLEVGKVCGIFNVYSTFAGWPEKTPDGKNAWNEYNIAIPDGGMIISGSIEQMAELIKQLTGKDAANYTDNALFESEIQDGALNNKTLSYDVATKTITIVSLD